MPGAGGDGRSVRAYRTRECRTPSVSDAGGARSVSGRPCAAVRVSGAIAGVVEAVSESARVHSTGGVTGRRAPDRVVEAERTRGAVGGAESGHPAGVAQRPALPGAFHPRLQHVAMRALDGTAADGQSLLAQQAVVHPSLVVAVVADQVVERLQRLGPVPSPLLHLGDALHQLGNDRVGTL